MCTVLNPALAHESLPSNRHIRCLQGAIPSGMTIIFQSISTAWVVFPVLYKSVFFPDYLLLINLFFLRGTSVSQAAMFILQSELNSADLAHKLCGNSHWGGSKGWERKELDGEAVCYKSEPDHVTLSQPVQQYGARCALVRLRRV